MERPRPLRPAQSELPAPLRVDYQPEKSIIDQIMDEYQKGLPLGTAAMICGIPAKRVKDWRKEAQEEEESGVPGKYRYFNDKLRYAEGLRETCYINVIRNAALGGETKRTVTEKKIFDRRSNSMVTAERTIKLEQSSPDWRAADRMLQVLKPESWGINSGEVTQDPRELAGQIKAHLDHINQSVPTEPEPTEEGENLQIDERREDEDSQAEG